MKIPKITTSGHFAMAWFQTEKEMEEFQVSSGVIIWSGERNDIPNDIAAKVATIHPDYQKYYADALAILWVLGRTGTENPVKSITYRVPEGYTQQTRGRVGKATRKLLGHWNIDLLYRRMGDKAEQNRVFLAFVEPAYSSQTCNSCRAIDKKSRNGEVFKCTACGHVDDADHNASMNILQRFLDGQFTVARGT